MLSVKKIGVDDIRYSDSLKEILDYYSKEGKIKEMPEYNPDWSLYYNMENLNIMDIVGAYEDNKLVGILTAVTCRMPHYSVLGTNIESFFVFKEYRKYGTAKKMLTLIQEIAKSKGSNYLFMSAPGNGSLEKAGTLLGFRKSNSTFTKELL